MSTTPGNVHNKNWNFYRVGLTGGIASGKSTVANLFAALGVPVIDSDVIAREVVAPGTDGLKAVVAEFGADVLQPDGSLDRRQLRTVAFASDARRHRLEAILHPRIGAAMEAQCREAGGPYQLLVIPLLVEAGLVDRVNRVLVVDCSEDIQRQRLMVRDGETAAGVERLLAAQVNRQSRLMKADDVLVNNGSLHELKQSVASLHTGYLRLASSASGNNLNMANH
ncbi:MAG: dephospho-CoA kinase [Gammaproteobacteria bacterium]